MESIELEQLERDGNPIHFISGHVEVYLARHKTTNKIYCVKQVFTESKSDLNRKFKEILISVHLKHPNINTIKGLDFVIKEDDPCSLVMIMEYYSEGDLEALIRNRILKKEKWLEEELLRLLNQMIDALAYMQNLNICHRDIKPMNILVSENGKKLVLTDLGCAKTLEEQNNHTILGTNNYLSPLMRIAFMNTINGIFRVEHDPFKSDVYSLGLVFLYMLSFEKPQRNLNLKDFLSFVTSQINSNRQFYPTLIEILEKMLAENEENRLNFIELQNFTQIFNCNYCSKPLLKKDLIENGKFGVCCKNCLKNVKTFVSGKIVCIICNQFIGPNFRCGCFIERCCFCKMKKHDGLNCLENLSIISSHEKNISLICDCPNQILLAKDHHYFYCEDEQAYFCVVCLGKWDSVHYKCLMLQASILQI